MQRHYVTALAALLGLSAISSTATAGTYRFNSLASNDYQIDVRLSGVPKVAGWEYVSMFKWQEQISPGVFDAEFNTFCVEITQNVGFGGVYSNYNIADVKDVPNPGSTASAGLGTVASNPNGMGTVKAGRLSQLFARHYADALGSARGAADFQTAVWEIVYDTDLSITNTSGSFYVNQFSYAGVVSSDGAVVGSQAQSWLDAILAGPPVTGAALEAISSRTYQDQVYAVHLDLGLSVPLPISAFSGGSVMLLLVARRQR